jgi:hypothetical protein
LLICACERLCERRAKQIVLEADARAKAIEMAAEAQKAALSQCVLAALVSKLNRALNVCCRYVQAGLSPAEASRLTIALRYVELLPAVLQVICSPKHDDHVSSARLHPL